MVRAEEAPIGWVFGKFRRLKGVGGAAVGTAALGLLTFGLGHDCVMLKESVAPVKAARLGRKKGRS